MALAVSSYPSVAAEPAAREDRRLLLRYHRDGDRRARDELAVRFLPLARQLARRYQRGAEPLDDLVQVASVGLVKAIDRFDPERTTGFSSYAVPTMVGELKRYFRDFGWAAHVPRGMQERTVAVHATVTSLIRELGRSPSVAEIAGALGLADEEVLEAFEAGLAHDSLSLDAPRPGGEDPGGSSFDNSLGEEDSRLELVELAATIAPALRRLPERDRRILHMRFVEDMTQSQIAAEIGVSQMHVSRLIRRCLARIAAAAEGDEAGDGEVAVAARERARSNPEKRSGDRYQRHPAGTGPECSRPIGLRRGRTPPLAGTRKRTARTRRAVRTSSN